MGRRTGSQRGRNSVRRPGPAVLLGLLLLAGLGAPGSARADEGAVTVEAAFESALSQEAPLQSGYRAGIRLAPGAALELRWAPHHRLEAGVSLGTSRTTATRYDRAETGEGFPALSEPVSTRRVGAVGRVYLGGRVRRLFAAGEFGAQWRTAGAPLGLVAGSPEPAWTPLALPGAVRRSWLWSLGLGLEQVGDRSAAGLRVDAGMVDLRPRLSARLYLSWFFYP